MLSASRNLFPRRVVFGEQNKKGSCREGRWFRCVVTCTVPRFARTCFCIVTKWAGALLWKTNQMPFSPNFRLNSEILAHNHFCAGKQKSLFTVSPSRTNSVWITPRWTKKTWSTSSSSPIVASEILTLGDKYIPHCMLQCRARKIMARGPISLARSVSCCPNFFISFARPASPYCEDYVCIYIYIYIYIYTHTHTHTHTYLRRICIWVTIATKQRCSETVLHKPGTVRNVDWIFILEAPAWRWLVVNMILEKRFTIFFSSGK